MIGYTYRNETQTTETRMTIQPSITDLIDQGALFVVNHSGGKDSQAMMIYLADLVPAEQLVVIHADLPGVEWDGTWAHIVDTVPQGIEIHKTTAVKTFEDMVRHRGMFPSPQYRQCTSDLKRGPIEKIIRRLSKEKGRPVIVNCMGLRAQESAARSKQKTWKLNGKNSKAGRTWYDWLPIHAWSEAQVFAAIAEAGQEALWVYAAGMRRASCQFCIMACQKDLVTAARLAPQRYAAMVALEREVGHTINMEGKGLEEVTGIKASRTPEDFLH